MCSQPHHTKAKMDFAARFEQARSYDQFLRKFGSEEHRRRWRNVYDKIRLTDSHSAKRLREIGGIRIMQRGEGEMVALFESKYRLQRIEGDEPDLVLEHILAG